MLNSRQIKFRQYWQHEETGTISCSEWTLNQLKQGIGGIDRHILIAEVQFTGLHDKNGVEIYELCELNNRYIVTYVAPRFCLYEISSGDIMELDEQLTYTITTEYKPLPQNTKGSAD